jgi:hypothetical protein
LILPSRSPAIAVLHFNKTTCHPHMVIFSPASLPL